MGEQRCKTSSRAAFEPTARAPLRSNTADNRVQHALFEHLSRNDAVGAIKRLEPSTKSPE